MKTPRTAKHVFIPSSVALTPKLLVAAMRRLQTNDIEVAVDMLIAELDGRSGDVDLEPDYDGEYERAA